MTIQTAAAPVPDARLLAPGAVSPAEHDWLGDAIELAENNVAAGGGPFGALIVRDGEVLARSGNRVTESFDPTAHAEVMAIRAACSRIRDFRLTGTTLISSCEPCPMCITAALWARVSRIVYAADRQAAEGAGFDDREFYDLLATPVQDWPVPVVRIAHADSDVPFRSWSTAHYKIEY
ncbi:nucleoside deaminase [Catenulispora sp. NF23]|uniref:Nucleoside deaminase n=1 Tax=Catenulispora pinistramenti TaxID=2705254 RepID=A0ABS5KMA4_9ACTN|nr:nucleoside deaminase [Catenulispora pinistramenti]MBS2532121.1 nucleoside deaminase [Catenulispora pinistramenti]MBS2547163.1 nucleoside deaminase [Catenulispora pinistramenti]